MTTGYQLRQRMVRLAQRFSDCRAVGLGATNASASDITLPEPDAATMRLMLKTLIEAGALLPTDDELATGMPAGLRAALWGLVTQMEESAESEALAAAQPVIAERGVHHG